MTDSPKHTIKSRTASDKECEMCLAQARPDFASYGCMTLFLGIVPMLLLGFIGGWLGGLLSDEAGRWGRWIGCGGGAVVYVMTLWTFVPYERRQRMRAAKDADKHLIEEVTVSNPQVIEIGAWGDNEPVLVFDVGDHKLLFLQGQWLRDEKTYGAPALEGDPDEEYLNGLPGPFSFPSTEFTVIRLPHSGRVLSIRVSGSYLPPTETTYSLRPEHEFGDSEWFEGRLDAIADVLAHEHERRFGDQTKRS